MKIPISFVAYRRPHYLRRCLESLRRQTRPVDGDAFLFVDGPDDDPLVQECCHVFREYYPTSVIHGGPHIGSNENFKRATFWPFMRLETDNVWVVEEDLEFMPRCYEQLCVLVERFQPDAGISTVSAWGCGSRDWSERSIMEHKDEMIEAHNHCGAVIFRRAFDVLNQHSALLKAVMVETGLERRAKLELLNQQFPLSRKPSGDFRMGGGWDEIYRLILARSGLLAISTSFRLLRHIGEFGKNSNPSSWQRDWSDKALPTHDLFTDSPRLDKAKWHPERWHLPETAS